VNGDRIKARRHAREIVYDLRWLGVIASTLYVRMADEFQVLVRSGDYAVWVAANGKDPGRSGAHGAVQARVPTDPHQLRLSPPRQEPSEPIPSGHDNDREGELWP
jgi:hypothetical protein